MLGLGSSEWKVLTVSHKPTDEAEQARIVQVRGKLQQRSEHGTQRLQEVATVHVLAACNLQLFIPFDVNIVHKANMSMTYHYSFIHRLVVG
jgi:hypothetical protein